MNTVETICWCSKITVVPLSAYLVHYDLPLGGLCHVDHFLHHVVGILVLHHGV